MFANHLHYNIPESTMKSLVNYRDKRIPTGGFLHAVLTNNLVEACARADVYNRTCLHEIVMFVYNELLHDSWGSEDRVAAWLDSK